MSALALGRCAPSGIVRTYQAMDSSLCYNLYMYICVQNKIYITQILYVAQVLININLVINNVTVFWKTDHLRKRTDIHVLPVHDRHTHALSRNTKHWTIDSQVCFYRRLFIDAVKP